MRQRLGVARALVNDPELVFLDEPTLGLDPSGQRQLLDLVARIAGEHGVTVVLSTHLLDEVEQTCDRVLILNRGRIVAEGTMAEVVRLAAAPRRALLQVPPDRRDHAVLALVGADLLAAALDGERGANVEVTMPARAPAEESSFRVLGVLHVAGIPVVGFTLEGGRLSDAFLAVTGEA
jgi:ABC-2 type transport system ATP-binding protein